jgi:hypothetical protein
MRVTVVAGSKVSTMPWRTADTYMQKYNQQYKRQGL